MMARKTFATEFANLLCRDDIDFAVSDCAESGSNGGALSHSSNGGLPMSTKIICYENTDISGHSDFKLEEGVFYCQSCRPRYKSAVSNTVIKDFVQKVSREVVEGGLNIKHLVEVCAKDGPIAPTTVSPSDLRIVETSGSGIQLPDILRGDSFTGPAKLDFEEIAGIELTQEPVQESVQEELPSGNGSESAITGIPVTMKEIPTEGGKPKPEKEKRKEEVEATPTSSKRRRVQQPAEVPIPTAGEGLSTLCDETRKTLSDIAIELETKYHFLTAGEKETISANLVEESRKIVSKWKIGAEIEEVSKKLGVLRPSKLAHLSAQCYLLTKAGTLFSSSPSSVNSEKLRELFISTQSTIDVMQKVEGEFLDTKSKIPVHCYAQGMTMDEIAMTALRVARKISSHLETENSR